ncbi:hypothetical protein [Pseudomonas fildesensis]|uniref:SSU ribosomal protein S2p (SAe) n=1 Tax=Pseudomonas fildesensis TaxID=1674920 RepID=A0A0J8G8G0_9PSED|nr:hypothetical protein [Pseudomonas fildesensis]KMT57003.1 hypothetical protein ACR52_05330 [Pseudomonas fildesensis]
MATAYINQRLIDYVSLRAWVLNGASPLATQKFDALNAHLPRHFVTPGYMVIVPSNTLQESTADEAWLMSQAEQVSRVLDDNPHAGDLIVSDYNLLQSVLGYSSLGVGSATSAWSTHLNEVRHTLEEIEQAYVRLKSGAVDREAFFRQRQALLTQLNSQLQGAARFGTGLRNSHSLRWILGVSTKSFLHKGDIKGYAERIKGIAGVSRHLRKGTYFGLVLDVGAAGLQVKEACTVGREEECRKAQFVEGGRLVGGVGAAYLGGTIGGKVGPAMCRLFLGIATKGVGRLSCGIIGGAVVGGTGGAFFGDRGAQWGEELYMGDDLWI